MLLPAKERNGKRASLPHGSHRQTGACADSLLRGHCRESLTTSQGVPMRSRSSCWSWPSCWSRLRRLNWSEIIRPSPLLFGPVVMDAPLGAILLGLLALAVVVFALSAASMRTRTLLESRHHYKELEAQRALADKAEASRFTELRTHFDTHTARARPSPPPSWRRRAWKPARDPHPAGADQPHAVARLNELEHRAGDPLRAHGLGAARRPAGNRCRCVHDGRAQRAAASTRSPALRDQRRAGADARGRAPARGAG